MRVLSLLCCTLYVTISASNGAKILGFFPAPSPSQLILSDVLINGLIDRGHQLTVVRTLPSKSPSKLASKIYTEYILGDLRKPLMDCFGKNFFTTQKIMPMFKKIGFYRCFVMFTEMVFENKLFQKLLKTNETFDAIIILMVMNEAHTVLGHYFGAPIIAFSTTVPCININGLVGNPSPYAIIPDKVLPYGGKMDFSTRLINTVLSSLNSLYRHYVHLPRQETIMRKYFPDAPSLSSILTNTSLVLVNSHSSFSIPRPLVPNVIEIGGFHVGEPQILPKDLQKFLDESTQGVVYFSMGSNLNSSDMGEEKQNAFLRAFANIKQNVLWKWENDTIPGRPDNVMLRKWVPQQDILAHPNVKLFITHGGMLSIIEAVARGVPIIGIPIFADQGSNIAQAVELQFAISLDLKNITVESVSWALNECLNNPTYEQNANYRSNLMADQPEKSLDRALFWIEYVIKHKGAKHLRSPTLDLSFAENLLLDIIGFIIIISLCIITVIYFITRKLWSTMNIMKKRKLKTS